MIHSYQFKNFLSFKDETYISFKLPKSAPKNHLSFNSKADPRIRLSKIIAAFGPNASGKTNLLKPLAYLSWFIDHSFSQPPESPLFLTGHFTNLSSPIEFFLEFEINKKIYQYDFIADSQKILTETLRVKTSTKFSYLFERTLDPIKNKYRIKQDSFGFNQQEAKKVRFNASLISTAAQYQIPLALEIKDYFSKFTANLTHIGRVNTEQALVQITQRYQENPKIKEQMLAIIKKIDFGLSNIKFVQESSRVINPLTGQSTIQTILVPYGVHKVSTKEYSLPFPLESNGTRSAFVLLYQLLYALDTGSLAIIDELEHDFHVDLLEYILNLFFDPSINTKNAQIIFTTHTLELMNLLDKTQIILVEKDQDCVSHAWCLNDMKGVRRDENWFAKYRAGAYRAIPNLE